MKSVRCVGHDGFGGCDHLVAVPDEWTHGAAYCSLGCYIADECSGPPECQHEAVRDMVAQGWTP